MNDLFSNHEKLYISSKFSKEFGPGSKRSSLTILQAPLQKEQQQHPQSPLFELTPSQSNQSSGADGTAIEYYQRELLLMKNELDFSNYMQQLNKFQYAKLKLKMNRVIREADLYSQSTGHRDNLLKISHLETTCKSLGEALQALHLEMDSSRTNNQDEIVKLLECQRQLTEEKIELQKKYKIVHDELEDQKAKSESLFKLLLPEKDLEINNLKLNQREMQSQLLAMQKEASVGGETVTPIPTDYFNRGASLELNESERTIHNLKTENLMANERIQNLTKEISKLQDFIDTSKKSYELQISGLKHEIGINASTFVGQYERKIQELSSTILKYEGLLDAKNSKIVQLSTSRPITIPENATGIVIQPSVSTMSAIPGALTSHMGQIAPQFQTRFSTGTATTTKSANFDLESKGRSNSRSNSSIDTTSSPPHGSVTPSGMQPHPQVFHLANDFHQPSMPPRTNSSASSNVQPIVKGRGGYQKRSKKFM